MDPLVSLILTTTGTRASLVAALGSALAQDFPGLEIIVVDDAGPDSTWTSTAPFAGMLADPRVQVVPWRRRAGPPAARNAGWRAARGRWLCYLDDDNEYQPGKVRAQYALAEQTGAAVVLCGIEYRVAGRRRVKQAARAEFSGDALLLEVVADTNLLFHRRELSARWEENLGTGDDFCLFQAILEEANLLAVPNVAAALVVYHSHPGPRANPHFGRHRGGQRRLITRWCRRYSRTARRVQVCRSLLSDDKFTDGHWPRLCGHIAAMLRVGGLKEWRLIANVVGVKLPLVRRWLIT